MAKAPTVSVAVRSKLTVPAALGVELKVSVLGVTVGAGQAVRPAVQAQSAPPAQPARPVVPARPVPPGPPAQASASPDAYKAILTQYCVACHNQRVKTADVAFDDVDLAQEGEHAELWEKAIRKLKAGMMPPPGARRPERATADAFASWLETSRIWTA